jgi:hypothetical protein
VLKTVPEVPWSHPFIGRLIGTIRHECLDYCSGHPPIGAEAFELQRLLQPPHSLGACGTNSDQESEVHRRGVETLRLADAASLSQRLESRLAVIVGNTPPRLDQAPIY